MDKPFSRDDLEKLKADKIARDLQLQEATDIAIKLCRNFTTELESYNPVTRCLVAHAIHKTYFRLFPKVFEALEKMGV